MYKTNETNKIYEIYEDTVRKAKYEMQFVYFIPVL